MAFASLHQAARSANSAPLTATGQPSAKPHRDRLGGDRHDSSQWATPMIGATRSIDWSRDSSNLASCVAPQRLASVEYAFSLLSR